MFMGTRVTPTVSIRSLGVEGYLVLLAGYLGLEPLPDKPCLHLTKGRAWGFHNSQLQKYNNISMIIYKAGRKLFAIFFSVYLVFIIGVYLATFLFDSSNGDLVLFIYFLIPLMFFYLIWLNSIIKIDTTTKVLSMPWLMLFRKRIDIRRIIDITMTGARFTKAGTIRVYYERSGLIKRGWITTSTVFLKDKNLGDFRSQISNINPNVTWGGNMIL
jgi:hypothetical protein